MTASDDKNVPKSLQDRQRDRVVALQDNEEFELTEWEENFLRSLKAQLTKPDRELSEKQLSIVEKLEGYVINGRPSR